MSQICRKTDNVNRKNKTVVAQMSRKTRTYIANNTEGKIYQNNNEKQRKIHMPFSQTAVPHQFASHRVL